MVTHFQDDTAAQRGPRPCDPTKRFPVLDFPDSPSGSGTGSYCPSGSLPFVAQKPFSLGHKSTFRTSCQGKPFGLPLGSGLDRRKDARE